MKRNPNTTALTKEYIESKISQELIVSKYLDIPLNVVKKCVEKNILIPSVFRDDDIHGSMGIRYNAKGKLKVRDFGGFGFFEDVYGVVAYVLSLAFERKIDTSKKQDFYFVLQHIAHTFSDIIDNKEVDPNVDDIIKLGVSKARYKKAIIEIAPRSWNKSDRELWSKWGVSLNYLNTNFVIPVDQYYIDRTPDSKPKYKYKTSDPCYAYLLGQTKTGISLIKLYFPLRNRDKDLKFITNCNVLEGLPNLELDNYDIIIITKSSKDRLSLGNHLSCNPLYGGTKPLNIGVINLPSENYKLTNREYEWLNKKLSANGIILSFLDFDRTGRIGAKYLEETYNIPYIFITKGEFGLPNFDCKDFAELNERFTKNEIKTFINDTFKYVKYRFLQDKDADIERLSGFNLPY